MNLLFEIKAELVKKLIRQQFPQWADLPIYPVEKSGNDNRTFHLGREMSVRLPSHERYAPQVEKENRWLPYLGRQLHLPVPEPVAQGKPSEDFPWSWSVLKWIDGDAADRNNIHDLARFARDLAQFLRELQSIDCTGGPLAGEHNFHRGGSLRVYDEQTRTAIHNTRGTFDGTMVLEIWNKALASQWTQMPVWVHGDIAPGNLLIDKEGRLCAVIDFGILGVGDPSCDLAMAWTFFDDESRRIFRQSMALAEDAWDRGRGWALWKTLITYDWFHRDDPALSAEMKRIVDEIIKDYKAHQ